MSKVIYLPLIFQILAVITSLYATSVALSHEFPSPWGWAFAGFGVAILGIAIQGAITSIPRSPPPKEIIPILKTGLKMGAIIKFIFVVASLISGWYVYSELVEVGVPPPPPGLGCEGAGGLWIGASLTLGLSIIGDLIAIKGLGMMEGGE